MGESIAFLLLIQIVLIALNAVFASAEIAVLTVNEAKLERMAEQGNGRARRLFRLTREPAKFLATIQVAITLSGFLGSAFAADNFSDPLVDLVIRAGVNIPRASLDVMAVVLITLILSYFTLIFGELVPKRIAMKKSEQIAMGISIDPNEAEDQVSEEEIRMMVDAGSEKGTIDHQEKEFIQNVFEFNDIMVGNIATHRTDVVILWLEDSDEIWEKTLYESRHTLFPVCDGSPDKIVGILNAKDYFRLGDRSRKSVMAQAVHPAYFVPETIKADLLFRNMKKTRNTLAVVMDEYGGMVGIVTLYDLIEELVGDLGDEPDGMESPEPYIEKLGTGMWKLVGNVPLKDIHEATGLELCSEDYDTFTGFVFDALGTIPGNGEQDIDLEIRGMKIHISRIVEHQVDLATISVHQEEPSAEE